MTKRELDWIRPTNDDEIIYRRNKRYDGESEIERVPVFLLID